MSRFSALMILAILSGCGGAKHPLSTDDGGAGSTGSGTGGSGGAVTGTGGDIGGGVGGATGGSTGTGSGGSTGTGGRQGGGGVGGVAGGLLQDGGLNGILDSGLVTGCPASPQGQACGGAGMPQICYTPAADGGMPSGCACVAMRWVCLGQGGGFPGLGDGGMGFPGVGDAGGGGFTAPPCPANAMGMSCTQGSFCTSATGGGCACLGLGGMAPTWRCF